MSAALFDLVVLWAHEESDADYAEFQNLLKNEFPTQFNVQMFTKTQDAIKHVQSLEKSSRPLIVITKLGTTDETLGQTLIETIRLRDKRPFIILHSHKACADPNLR
jgi:hypothetical protein